MRSFLERGIIMDDIQNENIDDLLLREDSVKLEFEALSEIKMTKNNWVLYIIVVVLSMLCAYILSFRINTQEKFSFIVEKFMEIDVAFIAVVFGAYALFQAMISDDFLIVLSKVRGQIKKSNKSFLNLAILYLYAIIISFCLLIGNNWLGKDFLLFPSVFVDNCICFIFLSIYFIYNILLILEVKNFAINLYRMFNVYNAYKIVDILSKERENNH